MDIDDEMTVSFTFKCTAQAYVYIGKWLEAHVEIISERVLPNTETLHDNDPHFRRLVKTVKDAQKARDIYINDKN